MAVMTEEELMDLPPLASAHSSASHTLSLCNQGITDDNVLGIESSFPQDLKDLDLSSNSIGNLALEQVANMLKEKSQLERLDLSDNLIGDPGVLSLKPLIRAGTLQHINLSMNELSGQGVSNLEITQGQLSTLTLRGNELGDEGAEVIANALEEGNSSLKRLDVGNNGIGAKGAISLLRAAATSRLKFLRMDDSRPEMDSLPERILALSNANLHSLSLRCVGLTDDAACKLASALALSTGDLRELDVRENKQLSTRGRRALQGLLHLKSALKILF